MAAIFFVLVYDPETEQVYGLNGAGRSPMGLDIETVRANLTPEGTIPPVGPLPVSVPGTVDGWFTLHERFGRLPMEEVLAPAIRYAEEGFPRQPDDCLLLGPQYAHPSGAL